MQKDMNDLKEYDGRKTPHPTSPRNKEAQSSSLASNKGQLSKNISVNISEPEIPKEVIVEYQQKVNPHLQLEAHLRDISHLHEAQQILNSAQEIFPSFDYQSKGMTLYQQGLREEALKEYKKAVSVNPHNINSFNIIGHINMSMGVWTEAIRSFQISLKMRQDSEVLNNLGICYRQKGQLNRAIQCYIAALEISPQSSEILNNLGVALLKQQRYEQATVCFRKSLNNNSQCFQTWLNLGNVIQLAKDHPNLEMAEQCYRKAIEMNPSSSAAYNNLGVIHIKQKKLEKAINNLNKALQLDEKNTTALINRGIVLKNQGKVHQSLNSFNKCLEISPQKQSAKIVKHEVEVTTFGCSLFNEIKYQRSQAQFDRVLKVMPTNTTSLFNIGLTYKRLNDVNSAIKTFQKAVRSDSEYKQAHLELGKLYYLSNMKKKALNSFKKVIQIDKENAEGYQGKAIIEERQESFLQSQQKSTLLSTGYANFGLFAKKKKQFVQSQRYLLEAIKMNPYEPRFQLQLADLYIICCRIQEATSTLTNILMTVPHTYQSVISRVIASLVALDKISVIKHRLFTKPFADNLYLMLLIRYSLLEKRKYVSILSQQTHINKLLANNRDNFQLLFNLSVLFYTPQLENRSNSFLKLCCSKLLQYRGWGSQKEGNLQFLIKTALDTEIFSSHYLKAGILLQMIGDQKKFLQIYSNFFKKIKSNCHFVFLFQSKQTGIVEKLPENIQYVILTYALRYFYSQKTNLKKTFAIFELMHELERNVKKQSDRQLFKNYLGEIELEVAKSFTSDLITSMKKLKGEKLKENTKKVTKGGLWTGPSYASAENYHICRLIQDLQDSALRQMDKLQKNMQYDSYEMYRYRVSAASFQSFLEKKHIVQALYQNFSPFSRSEAHFRHLSDLAKDVFTSPQSHLENLNEMLEDREAEIQEISSQLYSEESFVDKQEDSWFSVEKGEETSDYSSLLLKLIKIRQLLAYPIKDLYDKLEEKVKSKIKVREQYLISSYMWPFRKGYQEQQSSLDQHNFCQQSFDQEESWYSGYKPVSNIEEWEQIRPEDQERFIKEYSYFINSFDDSQSESSQYISLSESNRFSNHSQISNISNNSWSRNSLISDIIQSKSFNGNQDNGSQFSSDNSENSNPSKRNEVEIPRKFNGIFRHLRFKYFAYLVRYLSSKRKQFQYIARHYFNEQTVKRDDDNLFLEFKVKIETGDTKIVQRRQISDDSLGWLWSEGEVGTFINCLVKGIIELQEHGLFHPHLTLFRTFQDHHQAVGPTTQRYVYKIADLRRALKLFRPKSEKYQTLLNQVREMISFWLSLKEDEQIKSNNFFTFLFKNVKMGDDHQKPKQIERIRLLKIHKVDKVDHIFKVLHDFSFLCHKDQFISIIQRILRDKLCKLSPQEVLNLQEQAKTIPTSAVDENHQGYLTFLAAFQERIDTHD